MFDSFIVLRTMEESFMVFYSLRLSLRFGSSSSSSSIYFDAVSFHNDCGFRSAIRENNQILEDKQIEAKSDQR